MFTLQTQLPRETEDRYSQVAKSGGFSLHAGVATLAHQRKKFEHICRYVARPAVSEKRLALTRNARVRYELKTLYRDGTTHVIFEPLDFMAMLAALVPKPRVNLTRLFFQYVWMSGFTLLNKQKVRFICTNGVQ